MIPLVAASELGLAQTNYYVIRVAGKLQTVCKKLGELVGILNDTK